LANQTPGPGRESEWLTRKRRIDPLLDTAGWTARNGRGNAAHRTEEEETAHGPADYALWLDGRVVGIVEAKKLTIGPQNVLTQAERYARRLNNSGFGFDERFT
jgi:type I restriction enzyme R subunit